MNLPVDWSECGDRARLQALLGESVLPHFAELRDFRVLSRIRHKLIDIVVIALFAFISDCNDWVAVEEYGKDKEAWLRTFLELPNGIPSHDTFTRFFRRLKPRPFQLCFSNWLAALATQLHPPAAGEPDQQSPQLAQPQLAQPQLEQPQLEQPQLVQPQLAQPQMVQPQMVQPQLVQPQLVQSQLVQSQLEQPQTQTRRPSHPQGNPTQPERTPALKPPAPLTTAIRQKAVDGKTLRHSFDKAAKRTALHLVSVWDCEDRLSLGQVAVASKSNEITAIPQVLELVDLEGALVSIDAIGTQEAIAKQILEGKGDFLLAVKANQGHLYEDVIQTVVAHLDALDGQPDPCELVTVDDKEHGRVEKRTYIVLDDVSKIRDHEKWPGAKRVIMAHRECQYTNGKFEEETRYFICSAAGSVAQCAQWVRGHWGIENQLHWILDVAFVEDDCRVRKGHGDENLAWLRRFAVSLLGQETSFKGSFAHKRKKAARNNDYLLRVLGCFKDFSDLEG